MMHFVCGTWLPGHEKYMQRKLTPDGRYQYDRLVAAVGHVHRFRCAVDVGAHVGTWSRQLAPRFDRVVAFEPALASAYCFRRNTEMLANITLVECALGAKAGHAEFMTHRESTAKNKMLTKAVPRHKYSARLMVEVKTLDSFGLTDVDFLKIDVEGFEFNVVRGGERTIRQEKPVIIIEQKVGHGFSYGVDDLAAVELLKSWGAVVVEEINADYILEWR